MSPALRVKPEPPAVPRSRPLRVLIVDDERDTVLTLAAVLRDEGHETKGVYQASDVLDTVRQFDPDAVIMDLAMPGKSGWDVARELRKEMGAGRPLLIAISGHYTKGADKILAQMTGFNYYLTKPCDPNVLIALLGSFNP